MKKNIDKRKIKYGKTSTSISRIKNFLIEENDELIDGDKKINQVYIEQPRRAHCKNCLFPINSSDFIKQGIDYSICKNCGHLNGLFEDTDTFCKAAYQGSGTVDYQKNYSEQDKENFKKRVEEIYRPKAKFLIESLKEDSVKIENLRFADIGAGLGYFISALLEENCKKVEGFEVSKENVNKSNFVLGKEIVKYHEIENTLKIIETLDSDVVSLIGVLEHLQEPVQVLSHLVQNPNVNYIFLSLPTFGPSVFFELLSPKTFHRQLSRDHTHLYTEQSIEWICKKMKLKIVSEWWFGQDILDLYRHILVHSKKMNKLSEFASESFDLMLKPIIDSLQFVLDQNKLSNEVHILLKKI